MGGDEFTPWHHPVIQIHKKVKGYGEVVHFDQLKTNHFKWLIWLSCSLLSSPPLSLSSWVLLCCINTISVSGGSKCLVKSTTQNMPTRLRFCMIRQALPYVQYISLLTFVQNYLLWQHTYMQASSSSGKMPLDQHWDMFTALSCQSDGQPTDFGLHKVHWIWWENIMHTVVHNVKTWDTQFSHIM